MPPAGRGSRQVSGGGWGWRAADRSGPPSPWEPGPQAGRARLQAPPGPAPPGPQPCPPAPAPICGAPHSSLLLSPALCFHPTTRRVRTDSTQGPVLRAAEEKIDQTHTLPSRKPPLAGETIRLISSHHTKCPAQAVTHVQRTLRTVKMEGTNSAQGKSREASQKRQHPDSPAKKPRRLPGRGSIQTAQPRNQGGFPEEAASRQPSQEGSMTWWKVSWPCFC